MIESQRVDWASAASGKARHPASATQPLSISAVAVPRRAFICPRRSSVTPLTRDEMSMEKSTNTVVYTAAIRPSPDIGHVLPNVALVAMPVNLNRLRCARLCTTRLQGAVRERFGVGARRGPLVLAILAVARQCASLLPVGQPPSGVVSTLRRGGGHTILTLSRSFRSWLRRDRPARHGHQWLTRRRSIMQLRDSGLLKEQCFIDGKWVGQPSVR